MVIDSHIHFHDEIVSVEGLLASMDAHSIAKAALIPALCGDIEETAFIKYGGPVIRYALTPSLGFLRRMARRMYDSWVKDGENVIIGGKHYHLYAQPHNEPIRRVVAEHPDRFYGWIFVNPTGPVEPSEEVEHCLETPGMIGVKTHPYWHQYPVSALRDIAAFCQERELPILIHLGTRENGDFTLLPKEFPRLTVVYAHAGIPYQRAVCELAATSPNVFVDLSSATYVPAVVAKKAIERAGVDKCLFGSDGPYFHHGDDRFDYGVSTAIFDSLQLSDEDREKVGRRNFESIIAP